MKRYYVFDHQNKGVPFSKEFIEAGWLLDRKSPHVVLCDQERSDFAESKYRTAIVDYHEARVPIFIYPHSALPPWWYDGIVPVHPGARCIFVIGEGHKQAMEIIAPQVPVEVCGWPWCKQRYWKKPETIDNILFAPIHPSGQFLRPEAQQANRAIQKELLRLRLNVTCRYIGALEHQGLEYTDQWNWIAGELDGYYRDIDNADLVIAEGTFMYMAVARGKPTIGINQHLPCRPNILTPYPRNWGKYGHLFAYPINYQEGRLPELINWAASEEQLDWRKRMIGNDMEFFVEKVVSMI